MIMMIIIIAVIADTATFRTLANAFTCSDVG
jgi:hypothetical protein